jgi:hypothetical protein
MSAAGVEKDEVEFLHQSDCGMDAARPKLQNHCKFPQ